MSNSGRGRGYTGRHHLREARPGDDRDQDTLRLTELTPRSPDSSQTDPNRDAKEQQENKEVKEKIDIKYHVTSKEDEAALQDLLTIDEQYMPLLSLLEQFSPGEDGIQFNMKLRNFETTVSNMCPDEVKLHQAFSTFRAAALLSPVTARKLAAVGASFTRQQRQQLLRGALLTVVMQGTFSKLDVLERANPLFLINAANLMGDYFAEARLCNGNKVHILAGPLLQYMKALLTCDDVKAHRSLATQLMQNGRELLSVLAQELDELSISIRLRLINPPPVTLIWLLLSADLCLNKFLPLPNTLQQFYASHLDLSSDENYSEVSYGSWKKNPEKDEYRSDNSDVGIVEKVNQNLSQISLSTDEADTVKPKLRPILGAGAGLLRQEQSFSQDFDTWTTKSSLAKRYDLNSWRQNEEEKHDDTEPIFNPSVLPPNMQPNYPITVPDYPPPNIYNNYQEPNFANYLQQGDGTYIQSQYSNNTNFTPQGDFVAPNQTIISQTQAAPAPQTQTAVPQNPVYPPNPERVNNETQKSSNRRPVENWRKEKSELKEDNRNRQRNWSRQRSKDNVSEDDDKDKIKDGYRPASRSTKDGKPNRVNRRNSSDNESGKTPTRRHVSDVPRSQKYWDHDDRCDKDYNS